MPDIIYICRPGDDNEELRYSLRSLRNLPHGRVWIAGYKPSWVSDEVGFVDSGQKPARTVLEKYRNSRRNFTAAAEDDRIADDVVLFNDDFFVTAPIPYVPALHYGTLEDFLSFFRRHQRVTSTYMLGEQLTCEWVQSQGFPVPLSYALHVPMPSTRRDMRRVLRKLPFTGASGRVPLHFRTALGNLSRLGGEKTPDVKLMRWQLSLPGLPEPFVSSSDRTWALGLGNRLKDLFPDPGPYEITS